MTWPTWDEWLAQQPADARQRAIVLRDRFAALGADDAEGWARSEAEEDIAQLARFLVLRTIAREALHPWARPGVMERLAPATALLLAEGVDRELLVKAALEIAACSVFETLNALDGEGDSDAPDDAPEWRLMETDPDGALTGRDVGGLHESLHEFESDA